MFYWTEDMLRWMQAASEYSAYHTTLAGHLKQHIGKDASVCDAGCGLGYLSLALSPWVKEITALDISESALGILKDHLEKLHIHNVFPVLEPLEAHRPKQPYDAMVFNFFGQLQEVMPLVRTMCCGKVIFIKGDTALHNFTLDRKHHRKEHFLGAKAKLLEWGVPFEELRFVEEFGQPLLSLEDAVLFFQRYGGKEHPNDITVEEAKARLKSDPKGIYPYYLPLQKPVGVLVFRIEDVPLSAEDKKALS